jgi:hypothetical protein
MFDFRYHALSLSAVFLALLIGLLLGVAIGDSGLVSNTEKKLRTSLRGDVREARAHAADLQRKLNQRDQLDENLYPLLVDNRLAGRRIGIVGFGDVRDSFIRDVRSALRDTGGQLVSVQVLREPVPASALPANLAPTGLLDDATAKKFGTDVGRAIVIGGKSAKQQIKRALLVSSSGNLAAGVDSVILVRPDRDRTTPADATTVSFEDGITAGLSDAAGSVVGVEESKTRPSQVTFFKEHRLASVDNIDQLPGQASLVFALAGAKGAFGIKDSADALLPTIGN